MICFFFFWVPKLPSYYGIQNQGGDEKQLAFWNYLQKS